MDAVTLNKTPKMHFQINELDCNNSESELSDNAESSEYNSNKANNQPNAEQHDSK